MIDQEAIQHLEKFTGDRINFTSRNVNRDGVGKIYYDTMEPILTRGKIPEFKSKQEEKTFAGSMLALSVYAKDHKVCKWKYEPSICGKTPDFLVNDQQYIEIYSPHNDLPQKTKDKLEKKKSASNNAVYSTGLWLEEKGFIRNQVKNNLNKKSKNYENFPVLFLVNTIAADFTEDVIKSLKGVHLKTEQHSIIYYHGDRVMYRSNNEHRG